MIVLGIHFGHDGGACIVDDGRIISTVSRERLSRVKHAFGFRRYELCTLLRDANISPKDINYVAITTTQRRPCLFFRDDGLRLRYAIADGEIYNKIPVWPALKIFAPKISEIVGKNHHKTKFIDNLNNKKYDTLTFLDNAYNIESSIDFIEPIGQHEFWNKDIVTIDELPNILSPKIFSILSDHRSLLGYHLPVTLTIDGYDIPGAFFSHHLAHAACAFYASDQENAGIITYDGNSSNSPSDYYGGMLYYGEGGRIVPLWPHRLLLGELYDKAAAKLGLGTIGGAGKLMGLAPYGQPRFFDANFTGCAYRISRNLMLGDDLRHIRSGVYSGWHAWAVVQARAGGMDTSMLGDAAEVLRPFNADYAASMQKLFEASLEVASNALARLLRSLGKPTDVLCLSGGAALNCPANSRIARGGVWREVFVPPNCDDSGLALGAAWLLTHHLLGRPRRMQGAASSTMAYQGPKIEAPAIERALRDIGSSIQVTPVAEAAADAGAALARNEVIGWFEGRSETGPRALGHRSILADPRVHANWDRVNRIKGREAWRPFAPAVLEERSAEWFADCPLPSPFMLFTARVKGDGLPAITHVDGSSRIQTVARDCGGFREVIEAFDRETGMPVVMNTSLNGPGEPIVESPADALRLLQRSGLDALYIGGFRVTRAS